ncbi:protein of unknown function [Taphrina deformans PYCC 5710]|uniref:ethanolamine-phosphate cytidylyltransferase n=1 Tax=Taphrina deformans (strain PYCC 5710 / ATCC 11124 / CBS 356.35 / IMI 108563 / JCM 9778 / NBRC 8474) TaxID=1097556 RepID=R4XKK0_TAPDE|nr:protein of unknown function [Taphrina deformans PYCC 5710]|eukprot:CCG84979.1 protein of unknown function [Taphrina deformans PYCC 5710]
MAHERIYIDGCLDMMHHGHTGAIRQAKTMGKYLVCGVHSDEEIALNKGIPVMNADERYTAAGACKWVDEVAEGAPYVMDLDYMDEKGCQFVVHGDDITTDANGVDCYQEVKDKGRFLVCKRTPAISTTDLVGRMLLHTRDHHFPEYSELPYTPDIIELYRLYATDTDATSPRTPVYRYKQGTTQQLVAGRGPEDGQEVVYADGGWDLFTPGHVEMLRSVRKGGKYVVVGVHNDKTIHVNKSFSYPIMNLKERALTLLACRYVDAVVLEVPYSTTLALLKALPFECSSVYHGPLPLPAKDHGYEEVQHLLRTVDHHRFEDLNAQTIVRRIIARSDEYLERQRKKSQKANNEEMLRAAEVGTVPK